MNVDRYLKMILTEDQFKIYQDPPVWEADPPQREEYDSDIAYATGIMKYTRRVLEKRAEKEKKNEVDLP